VVKGRLERGIRAWWVPQRADKPRGGFRVAKHGRGQLGVAVGVWFLAGFMEGAGTAIWIQAFEERPPPPGKPRARPLELRELHAPR
jgi:hypothetical protein